MPCPVCQTHVEPNNLRAGGDGVLVSCPRCGEFRLSRTADTVYSRSLRESLPFRALVSHTIRGMQRTNGDRPVVTTTFLERLQGQRLPSPQEQADNLIRHLGSVIATPETMPSFVLTELVATVGCANVEGLAWIIAYTGEQGLTRGHFGVGWVNEHSVPIGLTFAGWQRYEELRRT